MNEAEASELVAMLAVTFDRPPMSEPKLRMYEKMLLDLEYAPARDGVTKLLATAKFLPSIAEIREAATAAKEGPVRAGLEAWGDILEARATFGFRQKSDGAWTPAEAPLLTPPFTDPIVAQCVEQSGGWARFSDPTSFDRDAFVKLYDVLARRAREGRVAGLALPEAPRGILVGRRGAMSEGATLGSLLGKLGDGT